MQPMSILRKKTQRGSDRETNYSRQVVFEFMCSENEKQRGKEGPGGMGAVGGREMVKVSYGCKYSDKKRIHEDGRRDSHQYHQPAILF